MRAPLHILFLGILLSCNTPESHNTTYAPKHLSNEINGVLYEAGNWSHPNYSESFETNGNHRFVVEVPGQADVVRVHIPWRRRDNNPEQKDIVVINATTGTTVNNKWVVALTPEYGELVFAPDVDSDSYYIYFLPHKSTGGYYPKVTYIPPQSAVESAWLEHQKSLSEQARHALPTASVIRAESIDDFHSFFPMEIAATQSETDTFLDRYSQDYYLFPEYRSHPIRMTEFLPLHWVSEPLADGIRDTAKRGEFFTFQVGVYAPYMSLSALEVDFFDLNAGGNKRIAQDRMHSFNTTGTNLNGNRFQKQLDVPWGVVQPMWFGIDIPENVSDGTYSGYVVIRPRDMSSDTVFITLTVLPEVIPNHGDNSPEHMTRLRWLNSTIGTDPEFIVTPFVPVVVSGKILSIMGREIQLNDQGLPSEIHSYFSQELTYLQSAPETILSHPITFDVKVNGAAPPWNTTAFTIEQDHPGQATWSVRNELDQFNLDVHGRLEYDGMLSYEMTLIAKKDVNIDDIVLSIPMHMDAARYMLGLGHKGGKRPQDVSWRWDTTFHQEGVWLGNVNKGLQYVLRDDKYERPLNTNFYHNKPLRLPTSWGNHGLGGISIHEKDDVVVAENRTGERMMNKGDSLHFNIRFLITPFKIIDIKQHFTTRFVHKYVPVDSVEKWGGTVINVHHANEINPYINYPFFALGAQKAYIDRAHDKGIKVKLYNTIRELTYKSYEFFALKSLGDEILNDGDGGGHSWLQEHMKSNYHSAWHATRVNDAAVLNKGTSRWTNYYIEGLNWLAKNQEIDGLYLDDIAFSRETVKRISSVLHAHRDEVIIDLHSANQFNPRDGFINSAFLYMEHFPYISRLWFGEYFDYDASPDYWLTEVSGLPFGLTGEMLEKGGHPYRGMVYGMTTRIYGKYDPSAIWRLFDDFDIANSEMLGYWVDRTPVKISNEQIKCTIYRHRDRVLIALGSWSQTDEQVTLDIDWDALGLERHTSKLSSPEIESLQEAKDYNLDQPITVEKKQGLLLILEGR